MKILIVDDDHEDAEILCEAIKEVIPTADCKVANSARIAQQLAGQFIPQFIFLDAIMYPVAGKDILRDLSQQQGLQNTTFIVMSGLILPEHHNLFTALGANFVITKPSNYTSLLSFVKHIIEPSIIKLRARLYTNESLIHDQTSCIQNLLKRDVNFEISFNEPMRQNIQFVASEKELATIKSELSYNLQLLQGGHWLPHL
ncbi:MAG TPA: response regulator [Chryseosolibacter sp.]